MKTLGELKIGDPFYLLYVSDEADCLLYATKHVVGEIKELSFGKILYVTKNDEDKLTGITIEKNEYNLPMTRAFYDCKIFADKDYLLKFIEDSKNALIERYDKMIKVLVSEE